MKQRSSVSHNYASKLFTPGASCHHSAAALAGIDVSEASVVVSAGAGHAGATALMPQVVRQGLRLTEWAWSCL